MAELRPLRVERGPALTQVIYGAEPGRVYPLRPQDVQQIEEYAGRTLEAVPEAGLRAAMTALGIPVTLPDLPEPTAPAPAAVKPAPAWPVPPSAKPAPVPTPPPATRPAPPLPASPRRNPWAVLAPIIAGGVLLLLLVVLLRSCGGREIETTLTATPTATPTALTPTPDAATVTARADAPVHVGPGDAYPMVGMLRQGQPVEALGISPDRRWYAILYPVSPDGQGWVHVDRVNAENSAMLPVVQPPLTPTVAPTWSPTATATVTSTPSPTPVRAPAAVISGPTSGEAGQRLRFDARRSTAAPGSGLTAFDWDFGDGVTASGIEVEHVFAAPGVYNVLLRVADSSGLRNETAQRVEVRAAPVTPTPPPSPPAAAISAPPAVEVNQPAIFDGRESTSAAPIAVYRWAFGDGSVEEGARVSHTYAAPGLYNVTLVIIDELGRDSTAAMQIEVTTPLLPGSAWALTAYDNGVGGLTPALAGVTVTALFGPGGALSGSGGCNGYNSVYVTAGDAITIGPPAATSGSCAEPAGVMQQEQAYFTLLSRTANFRMSGDRMELTGADGRVLLQFMRLAQPQ
jgi:PKD repeat protein